MLEAYINCPVLGKAIETGYCIEIQMASDDEINWKGMEDVFSPEQIRRCQSCKKHGNPIPD